MARSPEVMPISEPIQIERFGHMMRMRVFEAQNEVNMDKSTSDYFPFLIVLLIIVTAARNILRWLSETGMLQI